MTELPAAERPENQVGVRRISKAYPKIDMTPMVDLGFLLISFFIFTAEMSRPTTTNLNIPRTGDSTKIADSKTMTVLLSGDDKIFYYYGNLERALTNNEVFQTSFNELTGLGNVIRQKQLQLRRMNIDDHDLIVLIKPGTECSYKNVVGALDEMLINRVIRYTILEACKQEESILTAP